MVNYKKLYLALFDAITDAIEDMESLNYGSAREKLMSIQKKAEDIYIDAEEKF